ncbi:MAG: hypothetical protein U0174_21535 [Polyangiaceae bacterium]
MHSAFRALSRRALCAALLGTMTLIPACAAEEDPAPTAEDDIDVAIGAVFRDYATSETAGPLWFGNSMQVAGGAEFDTHTVRGFGTIAEPVVRYPKGKRTLGRTGAVGLAEGAYGVLVQFSPRDGKRGEALAKVRLARFETTDTSRETTSAQLGDLGLDIQMPGDTNERHAKDDGYYRGYFRFTVTKEDAGKVFAYRVIVDSTGAGEWETGLVAIHREGRPFYAIAHNPDDIPSLDRALDEGVNALGPDLMFSPLAPDRIEVAHPAIVINSACPSGRDGRADLRDYLRHLSARAKDIPVLWDVKPNAGTWVGDKCKKVDQDLPAFARRFQAIATEEKYDLGRSIMSVPTYDMLPFLDSMNGTNTGRSIDNLTNFVNKNEVISTWVKPSQTARLTWAGLGISAKALRVTQKWTVPVAGLVRARETMEFPKKIDFWSVSDAWEYRRLLDLGVDGLIADDVPTLRAVLREEPYATMFRYADASDSPFEKFAGGKWLCQGGCRRE